MAIIRAAKARNYSVIHNHITKDKRLSWKAKGIFFYAMTRPDDWCFYVQDIINQSRDGQDSVRAGLRELQEAGYLRRSQRRYPNGKFAEGVWIFYETPTEPDWTDHPDPTPPPKGENTAQDKYEPEGDFSEAVSSPSDDPALLNTDSNQVLKAASSGGGIPPQPPPAAAFSKNQNQGQKQQPIAQLCKGHINPLLSSISMPDSDKAWISARYDDITIRNALSWAKGQPNIGNMAATIKFGCRERCSAPQSKSAMVDENRAFAKRYDGVSVGNVNVCVLHQCVEVNFSACMKEPVVIKYDDRHFKSKFEELLQKYRLIA